MISESEESEEEDEKSQIGLFDCVCVLLAAIYRKSTSFVPDTRAEDIYLRVTQSPRYSCHLISFISGMCQISKIGKVA